MEDQNRLSHMGYEGSVEFDLEDKIVHGKILGIRDLVTYESESIRGLVDAFCESVEDYLVTCRSIGKKPDQPSPVIIGKHPKALFGELYQILGALDAPARVLDQVSAASVGNPIPIDPLLPFVHENAK